MSKSLIFAVAVTLAAGASIAAENLSVTFIHPEAFTDSAYSRASGSERDRSEVRHDIERHLQQLAARKLPAGETLSIEILDVDLAGRFEPLRSPGGADLRIVRDITWPRMTLRYTLRQGDRVLAGAEERLSDMNFMMTANRYPDSDRLRYEKAMLDDWFEKRIGERQRVAGRP